MWYLLLIIMDHVQLLVENEIFILPSISIFVSVASFV